VQYRIPRELLHEIRTRTSLVEVIGRYVSLQKRGRSYLGLCPFHGEKSPSFHVDESKQMFYCFGCQTGGDIFKFLTLIENESFAVVVKELADKCGVQLPEREITPEEKRVLDEREVLYQLYEVAASFYERGLMSSTATRAQEYVRGRQLPPETIQAFRLGYAPEGWHNLFDHLNRHRHPLRLAEKAGLITPGQSGAYYDRFRDRIIFPIRNVSGKVIAFGGRVLDGGEPKYLNSPENPLFNKSQALYGIDLARRAIGQEDCVVVVEGYFDTLALAAAGIHNVVASCGTSLTRGHLAILKRYTRKVVLVYDGDKAGQSAAERSLPLFLEEELWPLFIPLPHGKDPDDVIKAEGGDGFRQRIQRAIPLFDHVVMRHARGAQVSAQEREVALETLAPLFARLSPEKLDFYASFIAQHFGMGDHVSRDYLRRAQQTAQTQRLERPGTASEVGTSLRPPVRRPSVILLPAHEELLVHWMLQSPEEIVPSARDAAILDWMTHEGLKRVVGEALEMFAAQGTVDAALLIGRVTDPSLQTRLTELCVRGLELGDRSRDQALVQALLGIKEKNINHLLRHLQGEIARLEREGGDPKTLAQLGMQKVELHREQVQIQRRRSGSLV